MADHSYTQRVKSEIAFFQNPQSDRALPKAFHYWTNKHLRPEVQRIYGVAGVVQTYARECTQAAQETGLRRFLSIGVGSGDMEGDLAKTLLTSGMEDFRIDCMEIAPQLCEIGRQKAKKKGVEKYVSFIQADMNVWQPETNSHYAAIIANEILHHVVELERLFDNLRHALAPAGKIVTRDVIGRNGHVCWPEVRTVVDQLWTILPKRCTFDQGGQRFYESYPDRDFSQSGFEGIRAQDILPLLIERFHFEKFIAFGGIIERFTGRAFGHLLRVDEEEGDRPLVDMLWLTNKLLIDNGTIKPTQLIATLRTDPCQPQCGFGWTPEWCVRHTDSQSLKKAS